MSIGDQNNTEMNDYVVPQGLSQLAVTEASGSKSHAPNLISECNISQINQMSAVSEIDLGCLYGKDAAR